MKSHGKAMAEFLRRPMEDLRRRVAREAALLLYTGQEREFLQAKRRAAEILGVRILPSNREVAEELDRIADEREGEPFRRSGAVGVWESPEAYQRFVLSLIAGEEVSEYALVFHYDPPLGLIHLTGPPREDLYRLLSKYVGSTVEGSLFGGRGFASIIVDSEVMMDLIRSLSIDIGRVNGEGGPSAA